MIAFLRRLYWEIKFRKKGLEISPFNLFNFLRKSQFYNKKKIEAFQLEHLNKLISESIQNVDFYKKSNYENISTLTDLNTFDSKFPEITKEEIILNSASLKNEKQLKKRVHKTSGSTGQPMTIEISALASSYRFASRLRFLDWWGLYYTDKSVLIWTSNSRSGKLKTIFKKLENMFLGIYLINVFNLNNETIFYYFTKIENHKPKYIRGYKSAVYELAELMEKNDLRFRRAQPIVAIVTSEKLLDEERKFIERIFGCKVANEYGAADAGLIACECKDGSLHINEESVFITSNKGTVYVTEIHNNRMPLINYRNNDLINFSDVPCKCGVNLKVIKNVKGRVSDYIHYDNGKKMNSVILSSIMKEANENFESGVMKFKVLQKGDKLIFKLVVDETKFENIKKFVTKKITTEISKNLLLKFELVKDIKREQSGKLRYFKRIS